MTKRYEYNLIVIGAGSAGLIASYIAASVEAKVLLIEKHQMGGDCLNAGCVPSKALIRSAKYAHQLQLGDSFGFKNVEGELDFAAVMRRIENTIKTIEPNDSVERYQSLGVSVIKGDANLIDPHSVEVNGRTHTAQNIIIASGASPFIPPIKGIENVDILTSDNLWQLRELPKRLVVLGGGAIGCELSQSFNRLGSKVTQIEMQPQLLGRSDHQGAQLVLETLKDEGVKVELNHEVVEVEQSGSSISVHVKNKQQDAMTKIECDALLVAVGRKANTTGFGLEEVGVELDRFGKIKTNQLLRSNIPSIYAVGDVTGDFQFTHTASHEAWYAAVNALFFPVRFKVDYRYVPKVVFTDPEIAEVGLTEQELQQQNITYETAHFEMAHSDRAIADGETKGFIKVFTPKGRDKILGVVIVGHSAGEMLGEMVLAQKHGLGLNKVLGTIHAYPTYVEVNKSVAGVWRRQHKPDWILKWVKKWHHRRLKESL